MLRAESTSDIDDFRLEEVDRQNCQPSVQETESCVGRVGEDFTLNIP